VSTSTVNMSPPLLAIMFLPALVWGGVCDLSYCHCEDSEVYCEGNSEEQLFLSASSLPPGVTSLSLSHLDSLHIKTDAFNDQNDMKEFSFENVASVTLNPYFYTSALNSGKLENFRIENVEKLTLVSENCFENFPRSKNIHIANVDIKQVPSRGIKLAGDNVRIQDSKLNHIRRAGLLVEATNFLFLNNSIESLATHGLTGSHNSFNFSLNTIHTMEDEPLQVSALIVDISRNTFNRITGSPFKSVLPTSVCVPESLDYEYEGEDSSQYRVVSGAVVHVRQNVFSQFRVSVLDFPGVDSVPLGSLKISGNKIDCVARL